MPRITSEHWPALSHSRGHLWGDRPSVPRRAGLGRSETAWLIAGLVAVGVGYLAWSYLGPDIRRYQKLHSM
ncbi:MAG: hypothetical protein P4L84_30425 [Isosphaeraceae bacterium]|nr:hypothetical protein [Isosphaeraceae bacterium]